jgi:hypothetical protein
MRMRYPAGLPLDAVNVTFRLGIAMARPSIEHIPIADHLRGRGFVIITFTVAVAVEKWALCKMLLSCAVWKDLYTCQCC